ncbi:hypothetical protein [Aeromonas veronii]|uniref:hypothetical protein n=1 Tax=Aeromonas veronii TaxID=654 RepID=UPI001F4662F5|nr:hypothetical protein [Aeromonas veronii]MCF5914863.1 hypothetical protein [Aeromonas veronii]
MMISAEKLHEYSRELYDDKKKSEVVLRSAARIAYYALYHKLLSLNCSQGQLVSDGERNYGAHEALIKQLRSSDKESIREWGLNLSRLKSVRNKADYKLHTAFSEHDAYTTVRKVGKLLVEIDNCIDTVDVKLDEAQSSPPVDEKKSGSFSNVNCSTTQQVDKVTKPKRPTLKLIK